MRHRLRPEIAVPPAERTARSARQTPVSRRVNIRRTVVFYGAVALGSAIGGVLRALASLLILGQLGPGFPWGTLFVNVTGSFAIGLYAAMTGPEGRLLTGPARRQFVMTGICGGYTTFSVFSLETFRLLQAGDLSGVGLNIGVSVVGWLAAVWLGHTMGMRFNRLRGS
jgi:fluoride exporter